MLSCLISIATILIFSPSISFAKDAATIFRENNKAVVVVVAYDEKGEVISQGSGFIIKADGAVVTNYHVISNAKDIKIKAGSKVLKVKGLLHVDKENDIVILKAEAKGLQIVKLGDIAKTTIGEKVYVIGSPKGLDNTVSDGILSGIRDITPQRKALQVTAPISPGSSGGPVFNKEGEVIGIITFLIEEAQNLNFAMPVNLINDVIKKEKVTTLKSAGIEDYIKTAEYWFNLGYTYCESGMYKEAIEAFKQAIRINPDYSVATHNNLGIAYGKSGMHKEAIEAFKQAIRINPDDAEVHYNLGVEYHNLDMYKEAIEACKQAIRIKPDYSEAHYNLGVAYHKLDMHKETIEAYKQAIRIKPDFAEAHDNLGNAYLNLGMHKEAIEACKQAIRIKPDFAEAHYNLGCAYHNLGMHKEGIEAFKQAIRIKPDYSGAHNILGLAYVKLGMYKEGIEAFKQAIRIKPDFAEAHFSIGLTYLILKDRNSALEEYKILKKLDPETANELFNFIYK